MHRLKECLEENKTEINAQPLLSKDEQGLGKGPGDFLKHNLKNKRSTWQFP